MSAKLKPIKIRWHVKNAAGTEVGWSDSYHTIYVTWDTPTTTLRQETLFNLSCVMGNGKVAGTAAEQEVVYKDIYSEFEDLVILRMDSKPLFYYFNSNVAPPAGVLPQQMTGSLLNQRDGQCDPWVSFLVDCARIHAIDSQLKQINPKFSVSGQNTFMAIKNWKFVGAGTLAQNPPGGVYTHINILFGNGHYQDQSWYYFEVEDQAGMIGQGKKANPLSLFKNHKLVKAFGKYYDPSYGKVYDNVFDTAGNGNSFEKESVSAFAEYPGGTITLNEAFYNKDVNNDNDKVDIITAIP
jgi:hypothetical protein